MTETETLGRELPNGYGSDTGGGHTADLLLDLLGQSTHSVAATEPRSGLSTLRDQQVYNYIVVNFVITFNYVFWSRGVWSRGDKI